MKCLDKRNEIYFERKFVLCNSVAYIMSLCRSLQSNEYPTELRNCELSSLRMTRETHTVTNTKTDTKHCVKNLW